MRQGYGLYIRFALLFIFLLTSVLGCVAGTESVLKQNKKLILQEKNHSKALVNLEKAVKTHPENPELWYWLGVARFEKSTPQATINAFNRALGSGLPKGHRWIAYYYIGSCNYRLKNFDEAIKNFTQCLKLNPRHVDAIESRGLAYIKIHKFDLALKDFDAILKSNKNHLGALRGKSWAHVRTNDYDLAVRYFTQLIKITSVNNTFILSESYRGRGWSYYYLSQFQNARNDFDAAIKMTGLNNTFMIQELTIGKAFCLLGLGDKQTALALIDQVEKYSPPGMDLNLERALIYYFSDDKPKAWNLRGGSGMIGVGLSFSQSGDQGLYIEYVLKDSPASKSGLLKGDIITALDGQAMTDINVFINLIKKMNPSKKALVQVMREGFEKKISIQISSAEKLMEDHHLSKPILAAGKASFPSEKMSVPTIKIHQTKQTPLDVSGAGKLDAMITNSEKVETTGIKIDSVLIEPIPVQAGKYFEIIIDLVASDPDSSQPSLPIMMDYSVAKAKKLLKKFKSKEFIVPNGEYYTLTRRPKAAKHKGSYSLLIELGYKGKKVSKTLNFDIE